MQVWFSSSQRSCIYQVFHITSDTNYEIKVFFCKAFLSMPLSLHLYPCLILAHMLILKNANISASTVGKNVLFCSFSFSCLPSLCLSSSYFLPLSVSVHVVRPSQFKIRFKLQDWLWLSVVPSVFLPARNLAFNGMLPCC